MDTGVIICIVIVSVYLVLNIFYLIDEIIKRLLEKRYEKVEKLLSLERKYELLDRKFDYIKERVYRLEDAFCNMNKGDDVK